MSPTNGHDGLPTRSQTVEYHRPSRASALYSAGADVSLGMVSTGPAHSTSASSSPRIPQGSSYTNGTSDRTHAPSAFRSPPLSSVFDTSMHPSRAAPPPPGPSSRRDSGLPSTPSNHPTPSGSGSRPTLPPGQGSYQSKSATNSPNPNRYSSGAPSGLPSGMGMTSNGAPPPRPTRAGTLPLDQQLGINVNGSAFRDRDQNPLSPTLTSARNQPGLPSGTQSQFLTQPTPPPLQHQPFSAPGNPYSVGIEKEFEDKVGLGMGTPMNVIEPRDKDLPEKPITMGRNRSGTGKSMKDKKSVFGVLSGQYKLRTCSPWLIPRTVDQGNENTSHIDPIRSHPPDTRRF